MAHLYLLSLASLTAAAALPQTHLIDVKQRKLKTVTVSRDPGVAYSQCSFGGGGYKSFTGKTGAMKPNTWHHMAMTADCAFNVRALTDTRGEVTRLAIHYNAENSEVHRYNIGDPWWECIGKDQRIVFEEKSDRGMDSNWHLSDGTFNCVLEVNNGGGVNLYCAIDTLTSNVFGGYCGANVCSNLNLNPFFGTEGWTRDADPEDFTFICPNPYSCSIPVKPTPKTLAPRPASSTVDGTRIGTTTSEIAETKTSTGNDSEIPTRTTGTSGTGTETETTGNDTEIPTGTSGTETETETTGNDTEIPTGTSRTSGTETETTEDGSLNSTASSRVSISFGTIVAITLLLRR